VLSQPVARSEDYLRPESDCYTSVLLLQVAEHPFFWDNAKKESYLLLLSEVVSSDGCTENGRSPLRVLDSVEEVCDVTASSTIVVDVVDSGGWDSRRGTLCFFEKWFSHMSLSRCH